MAGDLIFTGTPEGVGPLKVGDKIQGPALIIEDETSTYVSDQFAAYINNLKYIELIAKGASI